MKTLGRRSCVACEATVRSKSSIGCNLAAFAAATRVANVSLMACISCQDEGNHKRDFHDTANRRDERPHAHQFGVGNASVEHIGFLGLLSSQNVLMKGQG